MNERECAVNHQLCPQIKACRSVRAKFQSRTCIRGFVVCADFVGLEYLQHIHGPYFLGQEEDYVFAGDLLRSVIVTPSVVSLAYLRFCPRCTRPVEPHIVDKDRICVTARISTNGQKGITGIVEADWAVLPLKNQSCWIRLLTEARSLLLSVHQFHDSDACRILSPAAKSGQKHTQSTWTSEMNQQMPTSLSLCRSLRFTTVTVNADHLNVSRCELGTIYTPLESFCAPYRLNISCRNAIVLN